MQEDISFHVGQGNGNPHQRTGMHTMNYEEGRYRVLLVGIGDNKEEKKESFCKNISEIYGIPFPLLKKVVDHCPTVLKKNLSLKKAVALANTLRSFGAKASVEEKRDSSAVSLEWQGLAPHQVALESSYLRKTEGGAWNVIGRVRNLSEESLVDLWVLIQLFDDFEEFLTFEEIPIPINPLPPGETSPFKVIFEGDLPIRRVSVAFKNASGLSLSPVDRRVQREWVEVRLDVRDEEELLPSSSFLPVEGEEKVPSSETAKFSEEVYGPAEEVSPPIPPEEPEEIKDESLNEGKNDPLLAPWDVPLGMVLKPSEKVLDAPLGIIGDNEIRGGKGEETVQQEYVLPPLTPPTPEKEANLPPLELPPSQHETPFRETHFDVSIFEEATKLLEEISSAPVKRVHEEPSSFPWIEDFRSAVEKYYQKIDDPFASWFVGRRDKGSFTDSLHSLLTLLVHARFNQHNQSEKALENTQKVYELILRPNFLLEEIPPLEGTPFFAGEVWKDLFHRALPKLRQVAKDILEKKRWNAVELERLIQIIPHMSNKNSRMAIRWIHELIPGVIEIDFADTPISVGEGLYRVGSRLGVVDPRFDSYQGKDSIGHLKMQAFARAAYPQYPLKIEDPMTWVGTKEDEKRGGYCLPTQPRCEECPFETFCPKFYVDFDPVENGLKRGK